MFALNIDRDPSLVHSVLIDKPAPQLQPAGRRRPAGARLRHAPRCKGQVTVVNVFASWCIPCRDEHPVLEALKQQTGVALYGINQKDAPENAAAFLAQLGNPYDAVGADGDGRASIDWGVYGVPETFVVDAKGVIRFKHTGPLRPADIDAELVPQIEKARTPFAG